MLDSSSSKEHSNHNVAIRNEDAVEDYLIAIIKRAKEDGLVKRETDTSVEDYLIAIIKRAQDDSLIKRDAADAVEDYLIAII